jgi:hypothetical protein
VATREAARTGDQNFQEFRYRVAESWTLRTGFC